MKVAASVIAADFTIFQDEIKKVVNAGVDLLHLDIMDGVFVPNLTFGPMVVETIHKISDIELDAHLMIVKPENYIERYMEAGVAWISFHTEATSTTEENIILIQSHKGKAGLALNPGTPFHTVQRYIEKLDYVLIMTVNPGFYGQEFMQEVVPKIEEARAWIDQHQLRCLIQVDGGINRATAPMVCSAGADIVVAGAGIFKQTDYRRAIEDLQCLKD